MPKNKLQNCKSKHTCSVGVAKQLVSCRYCNSNCKKHGLNKAGKQRFQCKCCKRTSLAKYNAVSSGKEINQRVIAYVKEGCSIRSIARILNISPSTVIRRIKKIGSLIEPPAIKAGQAYELDELCTYVGSKASPVWIAYAINKSTKQAAIFSIGSRSHQMLSRVTEPLLKTSPSMIFTDRLLQYRTLIPPAMHCTKKYSINHIERNNLTLRTHLKRLNRRTICFSRSLTMLKACLMIYFFC